MKIRTSMPSPRTEAELLERADRLAGRRLAQVAAELGVEVPVDLRGHKGWVGHLLERSLGATAGGRDEPDFVDLGIELKSLPVDRRGKPVESTFVCTVRLSDVGEMPWERSRVRRKLAKVLWVVVEGEREIPLGHRRIGAAVLWIPSEEQERALKDDWEELATMILRGDVETIHGGIGKFLQVRPKAANASVRTRSIDAEGGLFETLPRGFYLRTQFTSALLDKSVALPGR